MRQVLQDTPEATAESCGALTGILGVISVVIVVVLPLLAIAALKLGWI